MACGVELRTHCIIKSTRNRNNERIEMGNKTISRLYFQGIIGTDMHERKIDFFSFSCVVCVNVCVGLRQE